MRGARGRSGRGRARENRLARVGIACVASAALHAAAFLALYAAARFGALDRPRAWPVALVPLQAAEWTANRGLSGALGVPPPERPLEVVSLPPDTARDPARENRAPAGKVRFLAERNQTVDRETVSRYAGSYAKLLRVPQERTPGRKGSGERGQSLIAIPGRTGPAGGGGADENAAAPRPRPAEDAVAAVPIPRATAAPGLAPGDSPLPSDGEGGQRIEGPRVRGMPLQEYPRPAGGPNRDGLGLEEGAETRLHTRRFEPALYWTDVRARIQGDWERRALVLLQQVDPHEDTYFYKTRTVRVAITLDARGGVTDVHVLESSRLDFYDDIALAAVRGKQPYPPPPPAAIRRDGRARINMAFTWLPSDRSRALR